MATVKGVDVAAWQDGRTEFRRTVREIVDALAPPARAEQVEPIAAGELESIVAERKLRAEFRRLLDRRVIR